jgi:hypothetical protein
MLTTKLASKGDYGSTFESPVQQFHPGSSPGAISQYGGLPKAERR